MNDCDSDTLQLSLVGPILVGITSEPIPISSPLGCQISETIKFQSIPTVGKAPLLWVTFPSVECSSKSCELRPWSIRGQENYLESTEKKTRLKTSASFSTFLNCVTPTSKILPLPVPYDSIIVVSVCHVYFIGSNFRTLARIHSPFHRFHVSRTLLNSSNL